MTCRYSLCVLPSRPLNATYETRLGYHVACLNAKHAAESKEGWRMTTPKKAAQEAGYYAKRTGKAAPEKVSEAGVTG
jgi:hypothetical protein